MDKKHTISNEVVQENIARYPGVQIKCKLGSILENMGLNMTELSLLTGIRYATIHEMVNNKKNAFNMKHLLAIVIALRIKDISELFEIEVETEQNQYFEAESIEYREKGLPDTEFERIKLNAEKLDRTDELRKK